MQSPLYTTDVLSVLIVDDLAEDRITFRRFLTRGAETPVNIQEAFSIAEARTVLRHFKPHCVLLDYDLPDGNGLSLLKEIVAEFGRNAFGVVMLTASTGVPVAVAAMQEGAHDFVQKNGASALQLRQVVRNAVEKAAIQRELAAQREALASRNREFEKQVNDLQREVRERQRVEAALRHSQGQLSAIFNQAGAGIMRYELNGRITMVNDRFCEIAGRKRTQLLQLKVQDITHPDDLAETAKVFDSIARTGEVQIVEKRYVWPDGRVCWIRKSVSPILNDQGYVDCLLAVAEDITEAKRVAEILRESEAQLRLVADNAPVFLAHFDRDYRFQFVNLAYAKRFKKRREEIVGQDIASVAGEAAFRSAKRHIDAALAGRRVEFEEELVYRDLGSRWMHVLFDPQRDARGEVSGVIAVVVDITERKSNEHQLARTRDDAVAASRAKDEFLAALSHELRTPLNPVLLLASEAAANPDLPEAVRADFETIRLNVELEARLIDDLLDLTRITRNKLNLQFQPIEAHTVLRDALAKVEGDLTAKGQRLQLHLTGEPTLVRADPVRLQQVFWNVLKNAVKFTPPGGRIIVRSEVRDDAVRIHISDTGIGLTHQEIESIFDAFAQGTHAREGGTHRFGGLGLGLAISRSLVQAHEGRILASSAGRDQGATFSIELPLLREYPATPSAEGDLQATKAPTRRAPDDVRRPRVLLVEDHGPTRVTLRNLLNRRQIEVVAVDCMADARQAVLKDTFDVVISDIGLPDGDGCDLMADLRRTRPNQAGIALSGYGMEEDLQRTTAAGFAVHLTKPVNVEALDQAIFSVLEEGNYSLGNRYSS